MKSRSRSPETLWAVVSAGLLALGLPETVPPLHQLTCPTAEATVHSSRSWSELFVHTVDRYTDTERHARIIAASYSYEVARRRFNGAYRGAFSRGRAEALTPGRRVTVRYHAREPHRSVLWPRVPFTGASASILGGLLGWHALAVRRRRRRPPDVAFAPS
jgi:hypothetical protein